MPKNKISTPGYFIKRLRDSGYYTCRIFDGYNQADPRNWTVLLNPGRDSVFITHYSNYSELKENFFEIHDGGVKVPKNFQLSTDSVEVIITFLIEHNILPNAKRHETKTNKKENNV